ncbi:MAG: hypothetical protein SGPRY_011481 [Prymnesium sp.]
MSRQILEAELTETGGEPTFRVSFQLTPPDRAREEGVGSSSGWWHHPTEGGCRPPTSAGEQAGRLVISDDLGSVRKKKSGWSCDSCVVGPQWIPANGEGGGWRSTSFVEATCDLNVMVFRRALCAMFVTQASGAPLQVDSPLLWCPERPDLYGIRVEVHAMEKSSVRFLRANGSSLIDRVSSYTGLRTISISRASSTSPARLALNGEPTFMAGLLDQGYWPESLYTAPSDEAIMCSLGFNMLRKHAKLEPARWYYHCDRLGILDDNESTVKAPVRAACPMDEQAFEREMRQAVDTLRFSVSLILWVLFNELWGQHKGLALSKQLRDLDGSRLLTHASGWR